MFRIRLYDMAVSSSFVHMIVRIFLLVRVIVYAWGQIPLRYPASEPARELVRELVCYLLASWSQTC